MTLPAPGSDSAHHALRAALTLWELAEQAFVDLQTAERAVAADCLWVEVAKHALNCGARRDEPDLLGWVTERCATYARMISNPMRRAA